MTSLATRRGRGRPTADQPAARAHIIDSLSRLLDAAPLTRPSLRGVALESGVTSALLHYHFGDMDGLLRALLEERALPLMKPVFEDLPAPGPQAGPGLVRLLQKWIALTQRHRWLCACLLQSSADHAGRLQEFGGRLRAMVAAAQQQGAVRPDLPDSYVALLLLSMGVMPQLARTALGAGLDAPGLEGEPARITLRHLSVLQSGVARKAGAEGP